MGINKVPESGQNPFVTEFQEKRGKPTPRGRSVPVDKLSVQKRSFKAKSGGSVPIKAITSAKPPHAGTVPSTEKKSRQSVANIGLSLDAQDPLTGKNFIDLARQCLEKGRPYCFAVAIAGTDSSPNKKKTFMDGAQCVGWIDDDTFKMPYRIELQSGDISTLYDVQFFSMRGDHSIEKIGSVDEVIRGPNSMILQRIIAQEDDELYESIGHVTDIFIACAYFFGIGVNADRSYAGAIMPKLSDQEKEDASPEAFALAVMSNKDTRLAEFLLHNSFNPDTKDPDDETTGIKLALYNENLEVLRLFERYGYQTGRHA